MREPFVCDLQRNLHNLRRGDRHAFDWKRECLALSKGDRSNGALRTRTLLKRSPGVLAADGSRGRFFSAWDGASFARSGAPLRATA